MDEIPWEVLCNADIWSAGIILYSVAQGLTSWDHGLRKIWKRQDNSWKKAHPLIPELFDRYKQRYSQLNVLRPEHFDRSNWDENWKQCAMDIVNGILTNTLRDQPALSLDECLSMIKPFL